MAFFFTAFLSKSEKYLVFIYQITLQHLCHIHCVSFCYYRQIFCALVHGPLSYFLYMLLDRTERN